MHIFYMLLILLYLMLTHTFDIIILLLLLLLLLNIEPGVSPPGRPHAAPAHPRPGPHII